jgi:hypothetical protein
MTLFRKKEYTQGSTKLWVVEYNTGDPSDESQWFDLFEDPSSTVCDIVVAALLKANPSILRDSQEGDLC